MLVARQYIIPLNPKSAQHPFSPNEIDIINGKGHEK